jgi:predicted alpha/beta superfamily hydrolase
VKSQKSIDTIRLLKQQFVIFINLSILLTNKIVSMKKTVYLFLLISVFINAQVTLKVTSIPSNTETGFVLYAAGSFNGWNPAGTALISDGVGNYTCTIPEGKGVVEYKFTRGSWSTVEGNATGKVIPNRTFTFTGIPQTLNLSILSWEGSNSENTSTASSNVQIMNESFYIPQLDRNRKIWIYLPPDYKTSNKTYPVIYMHDGQNLFDNATSFSGEWQVDETLNKLFDQGDYGAIVVGIDNGGFHRIDEYIPWNNAQYGGGEGEKYMQFVAETLKPHVDANFRTKPEAKFNALIGSSLGGLISTYGGVKYSSIFSKIGSFSPSFWIVSPQINTYFNNITQDLSAMRIYFVASQNESATIASEIFTAKNNLQSKGLTTANTFVKLDVYGQHNESYWKGEFSAAYKWLFEDVELSLNETSTETLSIYFEKNEIFVRGTLGNSEAVIYDSTGKHVENIKLNRGQCKLKNNLAQGNYILNLPAKSIKFLVE